MEEHGALPPLAGRCLHWTVVVVFVGFVIVVVEVVGDQSAGPAACRGPGVRGAGQRSHAHLSRAREGVAVVPHISWAQFVFPLGWFVDNSVDILYSTNVKCR